MAPALSQPLLLFCQAILLGMAAALLYDLLRAFRLRLPRLTSALDILYCMAAGLAVFLFMLRRAQGQLRLYLLLGAVGGGVLEAVLALPPRDRAAVHLYYYEDMTTEEIARLLDRSPATVRSQLMRGRDRLRVLLEEG